MACIHTMHAHARSVYPLPASKRSNPQLRLITLHGHTLLCDISHHLAPPAAFTLACRCLTITTVQHSQPLQSLKVGFSLALSSVITGWQGKEALGFIRAEQIVLAVFVELVALRCFNGHRLNLHNKPPPSPVCPPFSAQGRPRSSSLHTQHLSTTLQNLLSTLDQTPSPALMMVLSRHSFAFIPPSS